MSLPTHIHLIRHGESVGNVDRTIYATTPDWAVPLTDLGREQARAAALPLLKALEPSWPETSMPPLWRQPALGVYLSPYVRARQTWDALAPALSPVKPAFVREDVRLREQEWSANPTASATNNKDHTWEEAERYGAFWYRHPSGESMADSLQRAYGFWDRLRRDAARADLSDGWNQMPSDVLIVTHGIQLRLLLMAELDWTVDDFYRVDTPPNCSRYTLELQPYGGYRLVTPLPVREVGVATAM